MSSPIMGTVRRFIKTAFGGAPDEVRMSNFESVATLDVEPPGVELTRANRRFILGNSAAVTGIGPVQALPTTTPQWTIFNNEAAGTGRTYFIEELGMYLTSGTPGVGAVLLACLYTTPAPTATTAGVNVSPAGKVAGSTQITGSNAIVKSSAGAITAPAAPNWYFVAQSPFDLATPVAFAASRILEHRNIQGRIAIPPQLGLGLVVVSPAGTSPLYAPFATWVELETDND